MMINPPICGCTCICHGSWSIIHCAPCCGPGSPPPVEMTQREIDQLRIFIASKESKS